MAESAQASSLLVRAFLETQRLRALPLPEIPVVAVSGDLTDDVDVVLRSAMTPMLVPARTVDDKEEVLAPFVHFHVEASLAGEQEGTRTLMKEMLPFENAAFLVASVAADLRVACSGVARGAAGGGRVERMRLEAARHFAAQAAHEALSSVAWLTRLLEVDQPEEGRSRRVRVATPKATRPSARRLAPKKA